MNPKSRGPRRETPQPSDNGGLGYTIYVDSTYILSIGFERQLLGQAL